MISNRVFAFCAISTLASSIACTPKPAAVASPTTPSSAPARRTSDAVYRLDFVLTSKDAPASNVAFVLTLPEHEKGEVFVGKNTLLSAAVPTTAQIPAGVPLGGTRQDVGTKLFTSFETKGDDLLLSVDLEATSASLPTVDKLTTHTKALAVQGKSSVVAQVDGEAHHLTLSVTPTKLR
ncbi:hypothetical protein AKJ09_05125 [Labilithrix luteola]|uniref:Lipoprotein n=1 Tax=Labilithrix luteola TaxID=1391654 RepID=A0A0K1PYJ6_9BACT|nr:hypothetical protein [Labilithrix luteola]AKU98461.1 hypothetical protein AKJ09_05125 [Labilithrix luteola]